jgi:hypothetical protein
MMFKEVSLKILLVIWIICLTWLDFGLGFGTIFGAVQPGFALGFAQKTVNSMPIQASEVRALIHRTEESANARQIDRMIEDFAAEAQITIYSLESEPVVFDRSAYYQNLAVVFNRYRAYHNQMVVDRVKILDSQHATVQGTTYEKINFSERPFNGVSNWQAKIIKRDGKLFFTEVNAYLSRANLEPN